MAERTDDTTNETPSLIVSRALERQATVLVAADKLAQQRQVARGEKKSRTKLATESDHYALWLLALLHGPRMAGEVRGLQWRDVNWDESKLTIERSLNDVGVIEGPTKTRRARTVVLAEPVLAALRELHDRSPRVTPWIFASGDDSLPWSRRSMWREFSRIRKSAKLPAIRLYDCRHTAATTALRRGVPLTEVSYMLGHARVSMTVDYYSRWLPSGQVEAARMIAESLPPGLHPGTSPVRSPVNGTSTR